MIEPKAFRSDATRPIAAVLTLLSVLIIVEGVRGLNGGIHHHHSVTIVSVVAIFVGVVFGLWAVFCVGKMGVITTSDGVEIRNWFRKRFISWSELESFGFGTDISQLSLRENFSTPYLQTYATTKDGHHYVMTGITATRINRAKSRSKVQEILGDLENERLGHTQRS